jgi:hypothetical protein
MSGWGNGTKIQQNDSSFKETRYVVTFGMVEVEQRIVTDENELWTGMSKSAAGTKRTTLLETAGYVSAVRNYVGGGQFQVQATKRTYGEWVGV